jgi:hypothetical protein
MSAAATVAEFRRSEPTGAVDLVCHMRQGARFELKRKKQDTLTCFTG